MANRGQFYQFVYEKLKHAQIPKVQKDSQSICQRLFALLRSASIKAACKMKVKSNPGEQFNKQFVIATTPVFHRRRIIESNFSKSFFKARQ